MSDIVPSDRNPGAWLCERYKQKVEDALGYTQITQPRMPVSFEVFSSAVANDLLRDKSAGQGKLWQGFATSPEAALGALLHAAQCKLLAGNCYGLYWLIPFYDKGRASVRGQIGYKGLAEMANRHPRVHSVQAVLVYKDEKFSFNAGTGKIDHEVNLLGDRSFENVIGGYFRGTITEEASQHPVLDAPIIYPMSIAEILKRRDCSESWKRSGAKSVWGQWPHEMARKTLMAAGLNHGEFPRDMGLGAVLERDAEEDAIVAAPDLPSVSRTESLKGKLGISVAQEPFAFAEEAAQAIEQAQDEAGLRALAGRWQHFTGSDAETIAIAFERRLEDLRHG